MKIDIARMEVIDRFGSRIPDQPKVHLNGGDEGIDLTVRPDDHGRTVAEIRYEPQDPALAAKWGNDDNYVLLDWFLIHDATVTFRGGRLTTHGYMNGANGFRRNGEAPYPDDLTDGRGNAYTDDGGPLARVRWDLA